MSALTTVGIWLWTHTAGNFVAAIVCGVVAWFWKLRPHVKAQEAHRLDVAEELGHVRQHRLNVEHWIAGLHARLDAVGVPDVPQAGKHGATDTFRQ